MKKNLVVIFLAMVMMATLASCGGGYYMVTDPGSEKVYYTEKIEDQKQGGGIVFKDAISGSDVTLQSSEVLKIKKDEFKAKTAPPAPEPKKE